MKLNKLATLTTLTAALLGFGSSAQALPQGLALVLDESGSILGTDWNLQKTGYANVLGSSLIKTDGSLVIGVWKFDDTVEQVFAPTLIDSAATKTSLVAAINAMVQGGGFTAIGDGVTAAYNGFQNYNDAGDNDPSLSTFFSSVVIDVSTDGGNNRGLDPTTASNTAVAGGVSKVNCLGIGGSADCTWNPATSLDFTATSFADFERILTLKIATETGQVPEPATLILMSLGLLGLGASRRKS